MKVERKLQPIDEKTAKVKELEAKKKDGESTKEAILRLEAKIDLLISEVRKCKN